MVEGAIVPDHRDAVFVATEVFEGGTPSAAVVDHQHFKVRVDRKSQKAVDAARQPVAIPRGDDDAYLRRRVRELPGDPVEAPLADTRRVRAPRRPFEVVPDRTWTRQ